MAAMCYIKVILKLQNIDLSKVQIFHSIFEINLLSEKLRTPKIEQKQKLKIQSS